MKIPINNNGNTDSLGDTENEVAGPGGAKMPGGEVTPSQDAGMASDQANAERGQAQRMEEAQHAGEVEQQTQHGTPSAGNPESGLPAETVESETSGATENGGGSTDDAKKNSDEEPSDELAQAKEQLLRLAADFENFKRQAARRETETRERAVRSVIEDFLPVLDNFERAVSAAGNTSDVQSLKVGVEFILQQFKEALKSHGVEEIESEGQSFDPSRHEAIEEIESEHGPGTVVHDVQRGYVYKGNVLRPSRVRVAK